MESKLVFLHISDIHLREDELQSGIELDVDIRNELLRDLRQLRGEAFDDLSGVLLTGDVAYAAKTIEFESALEWLDSLRREFNFAEGDVWCVPGNHDVDRTTISSSALRQNLRQSVRDGGEERASSVLHGLLKDPGAHDALIGPLQSYNREFAKEFQCTTECPKLFWSHKIPFAGAYELVLCGLNSVIVSDANDDSAAGRLVLGKAQLGGASRQPGAINVSLCHHPPRWLLDQKDVRDFLNTRTSIQLYGHEHESRIERVDNSVRVFAGALHPSRGEKDWNPRFNLIALAVEQPGSSEELSVRIWPRTWDASETRFVSAQPAGAPQCKDYALPLPEPASYAAVTHDGGTAESEASRAEDMAAGEIVIAAPEARQMPRDIVYRFYQLSWVTRLRVAMQLDLYHDEDAEVGEADMGRRVFKRANEQGKLNELEAEIERYLELGK